MLGLKNRKNADGVGSAAKLKLSLGAKFDAVKPYIVTYLVCIAIPLLVGVLSAFLTKDFMISYAELEKPPLAPPAWLFPIAWIVLYILMGISSATVIISRGADNMKYARAGLEYYAMSLALNFTWSFIFFRAEAYLFSFVWLLVLLWTVVKTYKCYKKVSSVAAYLQIPYIAWLIFAAYLNAFYAIMY